MVHPLRDQPWSAVLLAGLALGWSVEWLQSANNAAAPLPAVIPFQVPPGFMVERVAGPPLVECPLFACFDDRGRLYVADSLGINLTTRADLAQLPKVPRVLEYAKEPKMQIRLLEDMQGTGTFEPSLLRHLLLSSRVPFVAPNTPWPRPVTLPGHPVADEQKTTVRRNSIDDRGFGLSIGHHVLLAEGRFGSIFRTLTSGMSRHGILRRITFQTV